MILFRKITISATTLLVFLAVLGVAIAAVITTLSTPSSVTVVTGPQFTLLTSCTGGTTVTSISYGSIIQGQNANFTGALKNTGGVILHYLANSTRTNLPTTTGTVTTTFTSLTVPITFNPNDCAALTIRLNIALTAPTGSASFTIFIDGYQ